MLFIKYAWLPCEVRATCELLNLVISTRRLHCTCKSGDVLGILRFEA